MGLFKKKNSAALKEEMTVERYCDEIFRMREEGKTDKEIAEWSVPYVFFILKNKKAIEEECQRRHMEESKKREAL